jgi:two-component system sensor histidine kinase CreC
MRFTRITLFFIALILGLGFYQLARYLLADVEPQTFQANEEVMVDAAHVLAELVEEDMRNHRLDAGRLDAAFAAAHARRFEARIYEHLKTQVGLDAYLTDARGIVVFDSQGRRIGQDLSRFRDVFHTLRGNYGARSSREDPDDPATSILYVAAPVGDPAAPLGVLTVYKPQADAFPLIRHRRRAILWGIGLIGTGVALLITVVFLWLFRPIGNLTAYARAIGRGERPPLPRLGIGREVNTLAGALESMREALEGRRFAERYIHTLTHEMKSPLAAIRGAAELLDEDMPATDRRRFLANIRAETARTERLITRLLELAALEGKCRLDDPADVDLAALAARAVEQAAPLAEAARVFLTISLPADPLVVRGDAFILRAAVTNLLENAIDFSPAGGTVHIAVAVADRDAVLTIDDDGPGIPEFARDKVFERFYSLRHHAPNGRKGTGLGLTLVREAADLHHGRVTLTPRTPAGTRAALTLPRS